MQFGGKNVVDHEMVVALDLLGLWLLVQNSLTCLPTGQRLQSSDQVLLRDLCLFLDLLQEKKTKIFFISNQLALTWCAQAILYRNFRKRYFFPDLKTINSEFKGSYKVLDHYC